MSKRFKLFLLTLFILSFPLWWGVKVLQAKLENFFYWHEMASNPKLLAAQADQTAFEQRIRDLKPLRLKRVADLAVDAKSAVSLLVDNRGEERMLFNKNADKRLPIASLTKLMTAYVVLENYDLAKEIKISKEAVEQEESLGKLEVGTILSVKQLLYPLLIESSNDAAFALASDYDGMTEEAFVKLMNLQAQRLGLQNTHFINATGLDLDEAEKEEKANYSSARDLTVLAQKLLKTPLIWQILTTERINLYGAELVNSNKLLGKIPRIIGGKTGYTEKALGCFLLVLKAPKNKGYLINIILGTNNGRFSEMEKIINWTQEAYLW